MIKAVLYQHDGGKTLILGLTVDDRILLGEGRMLSISPAEMTAIDMETTPTLTLLLIGGDTEEDMGARLRAHWNAAGHADGTYVTNRDPVESPETPNGS